MKLTEMEKIAASNAMIRNDTFKVNNVILFRLFSGYCVQKMDGAVTEENRVLTNSWIEALSVFERFLSETQGKA